MASSSAESIPMAAFSTLPSSASSPPSPPLSATASASASSSGMMGGGGGGLMGSGSGSGSGATEKTKPRSLFLFRDDHWLRQWLRKLLHSTYLDVTMKILNVIHLLVLMSFAFSDTYYAYYYVEMIILIVFFAFFSVVGVCSIVADGLVLHQGSYLRDMFNVLDFVCGICFWVHVGLWAASFNEMFPLFGAIAAFRPLHIVEYIPGTRDVTRALRESTPMLLNVLGFLVFFWLFFSILGIKAFEGSLRRRCVFEYNGEYVVAEPEQWCGSYVNGTTKMPAILPNSAYPKPLVKGYACPNGQYCMFIQNPEGGMLSFDDILSAALGIFTDTSQENWTYVMYNLMDSEVSWLVPFFFLAMILIISFLMINLFIAVIIESFSKLRYEDASLFSFAKKDVVWDDQYMLLYETGEHGPTKKWQKYANYVYDNGIIFLVLLDLAFMAARMDETPDRCFLPRDGPPPAVNCETLYYAELIFTFFFAIESLVKLVVLRKKFFLSKRNMFNLFLAVITLVIQIPAISQSVAYRYLTFFQILRIYRVIVGIKLIRQLVDTVFRSSVMIFYVILFTMEVMSVFAVVAMQSLGREYSYPEVAENSYFNGTLPVERYHSFGQSFVSLYQILIGDQWVEQMYDSMVAQLAVPRDAMGLSVVAVMLVTLFLLVWFIVSNYILVNMVVAVILNSFDLTDEQKAAHQYKVFMERSMNEKTKKNSHWHKVTLALQRIHKSKEEKELELDNLPAAYIPKLSKAKFKDILKVPEQQVLTFPTKISDSMVLINASESNLLPEKAKEDAAKEPLAPKSSRDAESPSKNESPQFETEFRPVKVKQFFDPSLRTIEQYFQRIRLDESEIKDQEKVRSLEIPEPVYDKAFFVLKPDSKIRRFCSWIIGQDQSYKKSGVLYDKPAFDWFMTIVIVLATTALAVESPWFCINVVNSDSMQYANPLEHCWDETQKIFMISDIIFLIMFSLEAFLRGMANGLFLTPKGYFKNFWNNLDFFLVILMIVDVSWGRHNDQAQGIGRTLRALRALRPLRLVNQFDGVKEVFTIIVSGWLEFFRALLFLFLVFFAFAIWGLNLFAGELQFCNDSSVRNMTECVGEYVVPIGSYGQVLVPRVWGDAQRFNFNNVGRAFLAMFEMSSQEGWLDEYNAMRDSIGPGIQPQVNANPVAGLYVIPLMFVISIFVINLFIGVVVDNFQRKKGQYYVTGHQRRFNDLKEQLQHLRATRRHRIDKTKDSWFKQKCHEISIDKNDVKHYFFSKFVTVIMIINFAVLCSEFYAQPVLAPNLVYAQGGLIIFFELIYISEVFMRMVALGFRNYWLAKNWFVFDAIVVSLALVVSVTSITLRVVHPSLVYYFSQIEKLLLLLIVFRLVQKLEQLETLFKTVLYSLKSVWNISLLSLLLLVIYAIMSVQLFGLTRLESFTTDWVNFRAFPAAFLVLFRMLTGEDWNSIMHDVTIDTGGQYCVTNDIYIDQDCGSASWPYALFISFYIFGKFLMLNMFVVVILDNFSYWYQKDVGDARLKRKDLRRFKEIWHQYDDKGKGVIEVDKLPKFFSQLTGVFDTRIYVKNELRINDLANRRTSTNDSIRSICYELYPKLEERDRARREKLDPLGKSVERKPEGARPKRPVAQIIHHLKVAMDEVFQSVPIEKKAVRRRSNELHTLFLESMMKSDGEVLKFSDMLEIFAYRIYNKDECYTFDERETRRSLREKMMMFIGLERVKGLMYTLTILKPWLAKYHPTVYKQMIDRYEHRRKQGDKRKTEDPIAPSSSLEMSPISGLQHRKRQLEKSVSVGTSSDSSDVNIDMSTLSVKDAVNLLHGESWIDMTTD